MDKNHWDLTDIISRFGDNVICDWEAGPFPLKEEQALFQTVIDTARMLAMDEDNLKKYGNEGCRDLMNCLVDVTLLSLSEGEFTGVHDFIEQTVCVYGLLSCCRYVSSLTDWADPKVESAFIKGISDDVSGGKI